jgi:hypothetical protein
MSVLDTFKRLVQEEVLDLVKIDGKISKKDRLVAEGINDQIEDADDFLSIVDTVKAHNYMDEADLFRVLVDAIEEEGA